MPEPRFRVLRSHLRVNLKRRRAMAGSMAVMFNTLANGGFCPASYRRSEESADSASDGALIEEATVCFAAAVAAAGANWAATEEEATPASRLRGTQRSEEALHAS